MRCFTFGKSDITPVAYDPKERRYLVEHDYLSADFGARVVKDAQTINQALGYEMNTIEFAIEDGIPYAIDFLNPAPDFERDRITEFYFVGHVVDKMAKLVIDRALKGNVANSWPRWEEMLGSAQHPASPQRPPQLPARTKRARARAQPQAQNLPEQKVWERRAHEQRLSLRVPFICFEEPSDGSASTRPRTDIRAGAAARLSHGTRFCGPMSSFLRVLR